jgi:hypothetical protein
MFGLFGFGNGNNGNSGNPPKDGSAFGRKCLEYSNLTYDNSHWCISHKISHRCLNPGCNNRVFDQSDYCFSHK